MFVCEISLFGLTFFFFGEEPSSESFNFCSLLKFSSPDPPLKYSIKDKKTGITHAGVELLTNKIRTFAERGHKKLAKGVSCLSDVRFASPIYSYMTEK